MKTRLVYLDRLKVFMTALVILHHTSITYGGAGSWMYYEHQNNDVANALLTLFTAVNQSFFMGLFFFISGFVTPASYDRKGGGSFLKARLFRFGIPLLFYMVVIDPLLRYVYSGYEGSIGSYLKNTILPHPLLGVTEFAIGPLWYLFALLLFFVGYAGVRLVTGGQTRNKPLRLTPRLIAGYLVSVAAANFLVRLAYPVGEEWLRLQLAYFPAYIGLFMAGIAAYRGDWLQQLTETAARKWKWAVALLILLLPIGMAFGGALEGDTTVFMGGLSWQAAMYAIMDPLLGFGISYVLLVWFRKRWNGMATKATGWLSGNAFLVYIIHALFVTYVAVTLRTVTLHPLMKFVMVGCVAIMLSFTAASMIRRIPGVKKVV